MNKTTRVNQREPSRQLVSVRVYFFGLIAIMTGERSVALELPADATIRDMLAVLSERYGKSTMDNLMRTSEQTASYCRISVNGRLAKGIDVPLGADGAATVEIILLSAQEGG